MPRKTSLWGLSLLAAACGGGARRLSAPPAVGEQVRVELLEAEIDGEHVALKMSAQNDSPHAIVVDRNQIAVIGPDGRERYRSGGKGARPLKQGKRTRLDVDIATPGMNWDTVPGFWVRFDGFWAEDVPLRLPPMAVGEPSGDPPGPPTANFQPPPEAMKVRAAREKVDAKEAKKKERKDRRGNRGAVAGSGANDSLQEYKGVRRKLKQDGVRCAAMPLNRKEVSEDVTFIMDELLLTELQQVGFEAIGPDDINAMVGFEGMKDAVGCDDASCMAELGNSLGVPYITAGNVAKLEGSTVITLKLIDVQNTKVIARVSQIADGGTEVLPRIIAEAVQDLVQRSAL